MASTVAPPHGLRRWIALALVVLATGLAVVNVQLTPGVYWARTEVVLLGPPNQVRPNKLDSNSAGLIATAGLIEREMRATRTSIPATSNEVTLVDQGVYDGEQVRMPNYGGQWATNFDQPVIDLQASAASPQVVRDRMLGMIAQAQAILRRRQDEAHVAPANRISIALSPAQIRVNYSAGAKPRAQAVLLLVGALLAAGCARGLLPRRSPKQRARNSQEVIWS
jgi:hypothetical protein